ncbi:bud-site-selection protein [Emydomyces testavorans]|uniref:Bud-site-selection protein n=1 Tax=Emydomyces testavorans TaxID=2070801 RepID=A0AAF0IJ20_9EURO|nr:bud-site-selection protein [Emydomyces testavorans]
MPKRKRDDCDETSSSDPQGRRLTLRATRLEQKIELGIQQIHRALKTARGFERQKLGRRQKNAQSSGLNAQLSRLCEEVQALKSLDLLELSRKHLVKQLLKTKRICESPAFTQLKISKQNVFNGKKEGPEANVTARLFSSNPVKGVLPGIMDGIRNILGLEGVRAPSNKTSTSEEVSKTPKAAAPKVSKRPLPAEKPDIDQGDISIGENEDGCDFAQFDDRIASSSGSESEDNNESTFKTQKGTNYDPVKDLSLSPTPSITDSESSQDITVKSTKRTKSSGKAASTTFLPSLTMGGYWSGTESDAEEDDETAAAIAPRKNRMGQQARRKLWEKKFGANANHVRKQAESNHRDSGWDMRRGATSQEDQWKDRGKYKRLTGQSTGQRVAQSKGEHFGKPHGPSRQQQHQKPLHPSWEAARKAKEKKSQVKFEGKKVVF